MHMIPLSSTALHTSYRISHLTLPSARERLHVIAMGLHPNSVIQKIRPTPFGDPVEYLIDGERLIAIDRAIATHIVVEEIHP